MAFLLPFSQRAKLAGGFIRILNNSVRRKMKIVAAIIFGFLSITGFAERVGREAEIENSTQAQLEELKGRLVVFEGVAWGEGWPGLGKRVVLGTGARIYFGGKKTVSDFPNGRLVRVHGRLVLRHIRAAQGIEAGYDRSFDCWTVEDPAIEVIDKIETDAVELHEGSQNKQK